MFFSEFGLSKIGIVACLKGKRHSDKLWGLLWLAQSSCVLLHMALQLQVKALSTRHEAQIRMLSQCTSHMSMSFSAFGSTWNSSQSQIATVKQCTSHSKAGQFAQSQRVYANWEWPLWCLQIHAKHPKQRGHWCGHNMHACAVSEGRSNCIAFRYVPLLHDVTCITSYAHAYSLQCFLCMARGLQDHLTTWIMEACGWSVLSKEV